MANWTAERAYEKDGKYFIVYHVEVNSNRLGLDRMVTEEVTLKEYQRYHGVEEKKAPIVIDHTPSRVNHEKPTLTLKGE